MILSVWGTCKRGRNKNIMKDKTYKIHKRALSNTKELERILEKVDEGHLLVNISLLNLNCIASFLGKSGK